MKSLKQRITDMRLSGMLARFKGWPREYKGDYTPGSAEWLAWFEGYDNADKPATADRAAALAQMRGRITLYEDAGAKRATIILSTDADAVSVTYWKRYRTMKVSCVIKVTKPGLMTEAALALEVLAEIAARWGREAAGEAASDS